MKKFCFVFSVLLFSASAFAQHYFLKTYGGAGAYSDFAAIIKTADGGFAATGYTELNGAKGEVLLVKLDATGNIQWSKTYGTDSVDAGAALQQMPDGGFAIAGYTYGSPNDVAYDDGLLIRTNANGNLLWSKAFGGNDYDEFAALTLQDSMLVASGNTSSFGTGLEAGLITRTDASGNLDWAVAASQNLFQAYQAVIKTSDGNYLAAGQTLKSGSLSFDPFIVNYNNDGSVLWSKRFGITGGQVIYAIAEAKDGGYVFTGTSPASVANSSPEILIAKIAHDGTFEWAKTFGSPFYDRAQSIVINSDSSITVAGHTRIDTATNRDVVSAISVTGSGVFKWSKILADTTAGSHVTAMCSGAANSFAMAGYTYVGQTYGAGFVRYTNMDASTPSCNQYNVSFTQSSLTATDSVGVNEASGGTMNNIVLNQANVNLTIDTVCDSLVIISAVEKIEKNNSMMLFPNPSTTQLNIVFNDFAVVQQVNIFDVAGKILFSTPKINSSLLTVDVRNFAPGIYLVRTETENGWLTKKFLKE